jgi:hypothetical protein
MPPNAAAMATLITRATLNDVEPANSPCRRARPHRRVIAEMAGRAGFELSPDLEDVVSRVVCYQHIRSPELTERKS